MDGLDRDFRFVTTAAKRAVAEARAAVAAVSRSRRSTRGAAMSEHVTATLDAIEERVGDTEERFSTASDDLERVAATETMRLVNGFLSQMQEAVPWIQAGADPPLQLGALYLIDETSTAVVGRACDVIAYGDATYQYATISWPFASILTRLGRTPSAGARPVVIFFPPRDDRAFLLHALFVHELGHSAVREHGLASAVITSKSHDPAWASAFDAAVRDFAARHTNNDVITARLLLTQQLDRWVTELICDDFGTQYGGPPYLFAFAAVVSAISWNEPQSTHPPTTTRIRFILSELEERGWRPTLESGCPEVLEWLEHVAGAARASGIAPYEEFLIHAAEELRSTIRTEVAAILATHVYDPPDYDACCEEIQVLLEERVLPAQLKSGDPVDRRAVLTAGWLHVFRGSRAPGSEGDDAASIPRAITNVEFQEFLAKAVEMSKVLETWSGA